MVRPMSCKFNGIHTVEELEGTRAEIFYATAEDGARFYHFNKYRREHSDGINGDDVTCASQELPFVTTLEKIVERKTFEYSKGSR